MVFDKARQMLVDRMRKLSIALRTNCVWMATGQMGGMAGAALEFAEGAVDR
jgi:hypothetical protein